MKNDFRFSAHNKTFGIVNITNIKGVLLFFEILIEFFSKISHWGDYLPRDCFWAIGYEGLIWDELCWSILDPHL